MSGIEPFQFEPIYQPGEEPPQEESVEQETEECVVLWLLHSSHVVFKHFLSTMVSSIGLRW